MSMTASPQSSPRPPTSASAWRLTATAGTTTTSTEWAPAGLPGTAHSMICARLVRGQLPQATGEASGSTRRRRLPRDPPAGQRQLAGSGPQRGSHGACRRVGLQRVEQRRSPVATGPASPLTKTRISPFADAAPRLRATPREMRPDVRITVTSPPSRSISAAVASVDPGSTTTTSNDRSGGRPSASQEASLDTSRATVGNDHHRDRRRRRVPDRAGRWRASLSTIGEGRCRIVRIASAKDRSSCLLGETGRGVGQPARRPLIMKARRATDAASTRPRGHRRGGRHKRQRTELGETLCP